MRSRIERTWGVLRTAVGKDLFNPPASDDRAKPAAKKRADKLCEKAVRKADELREELLFSTPDFAQQGQFGGAVEGYIFSTRVGKTGYYRDTPTAPTNNGTSAEDVASCFAPVPIAIQHHLGGRAAPLQ